jgi:hypothetical protein
MFKKRRCEHVASHGKYVRGWSACQKLDGCRGYWDGTTMWSRSGRSIPLPRECDELPRMHLDREIFAVRRQWRRRLLQLCATAGRQPCVSSFSTRRKSPGVGRSGWRRRRRNCDAALLPPCRTRRSRISCTLADVPHDPRKRRRGVDSTPAGRELLG